MIRMTLLMMFALALNAGGQESKMELQTKSNKKMEITNKQKVVELLNSIETGAPGPVAYINPAKYIQHNQGVADGLEGFGALLQQIPEGTAKVNTVRVFEDGDYVVAHTEYNFFGPKVGFDIFRFEDGLIVEHWDNLQEIVTETASGRTQTDGPAEITGTDKTDENKILVENLINDVFLGRAPEKITTYISTEQYDQHNPAVKDGLTGLGEALQSYAEAGTPMVYQKNHVILGEGNFVLSVSEGIFMKKKVAFYDLFRIDAGKVVEHWDAIQEVVPEAEALNTNGKYGF